MSATADIVIIGGGAMGTSAAFYLAQRGHGKVVLLERTSLAAGASGKSTAVVRQHYSNPIYARWAKLALNVFRNFREIVGGDSGFIPCGYCVIVGPEDVAPLKANIAMLQSIGVHTELLSPALLGARQPHLYLDDVVLAAIEPEAGCAEPRLTVQALAAAARGHGAEIREGEPVVEILRERRRVVGVQTAHDTLHAGLVVDAAGAFAIPLAEQAGYSCELRLVRHEIVLFRQPAGVPPEHMIISDRINVAYFRPKRGNLTLVGASDPTEGTNVTDPEEETISASPEAQERYTRRLASRFPAFRDQPQADASYTGRYHTASSSRPSWDNSWPNILRGIR
jgi:sarcosine oxidase subunit beta